MVAPASWKDPALSALVIACGSVLRAAKSVATRSPWWSCCELGLSDDAVDVMRSSLRRLTKSDMHQLLGNEGPCSLATGLPAPWRDTFRWNDLLVLPLLVCMGEALRSKYRGGALYENVAPEMGIAGWQCGQLFPTGHPTTAFKRAMRSTAIRLHMRHHFQESDDDQEFRKPWYRLLWLQSGPGRFHLLEHSGRIDRQGSVTARSLVGFDGHGQRSETFVQLLHELQRLRGLFVDPTESRSILSRNPWIRPEWVDQLMERATARNIAIVDELTEGAEFQPDEIIEQPVVELDHLAITAEGETLAVLNLLPTLTARCAGADKPLLRIAGQAEFHLLRTDDGGLSPDQKSPHSVQELKSNQIAVRPRQSLLLSLDDEEGKLLANMEVELWSPRATVAAFDLEGRRIGDDDGLQPSVLVMRQGLRLEPADSLISQENFDGWEVLQLAIILREPIRIIDDDIVLWSWGESSEKVAIQHEAEVVSRGGTNHPGHPPLIGENVQLAVRPSRAGDMVLSVRAGDGRRTRFEPKAGPRSLSYRMPNDRTTEQALLHVLLDGQGKPFCSHARVMLQAVGAVQIGARGRVRLGMDSELERADGVTSSFELGCDRSDASAHGCWVVLEGDRYVARAGECGGMFRAPTLFGLGEPLVARPGPFNPSPRTEQVLAAAVIDHGTAISEVLDDQLSEPQFHLDIARPLRVDDNQRIVVLHADGRVEVEVPASLEEIEAGHRWTTLPRSDGPDVIAIAATSAEARIGAIWSSAWLSSIRLPEEAPQIAQLIHALLWFRMPIAGQCTYPLWRQLAHKHLAVTLSTLLQPSDVVIPGASVRLNASPRGASAVARLVLRLAADDVRVHASDVVDALGGDPVSTVRQLSRIDPAAAARIAIGFAIAHSTSARAMQQAELLVAAATNILSKDQLEQSILRCGQSLRRLQNSLDERFLEGIIDSAARQAVGKACTAAEQHNLGISLSAAPDVCAPITYGVFKRLALTGT